MISYWTVSNLFASQVKRNFIVKALSFLNKLFPIYLLLRWRETVKEKNFPEFSKEVSNLFASQVKRNYCRSPLWTRWLSKEFPIYLLLRWRETRDCRSYRLSMELCFQSICFSGEEKHKKWLNILMNYFLLSFQSICFSGEEKLVKMTLRLKNFLESFPIYLLLRWRETFFSHNQKNSIKNWVFPIYLLLRWRETERREKVCSRLCTRVSNLFASQVKRNETISESTPIGPPKSFQSICFSGEEKLTGTPVAIHLWRSGFQSICFSGEEKQIS